MAKDNKLKSVGILNLGFKKQPYICRLKRTKSFLIDVTLIDKRPLKANETEIISSFFSKLFLI